LQLNNLIYYLIIGVMSRVNLTGKYQALDQFLDQREKPSFSGPKHVIFWSSREINICPGTLPNSTQGVRVRGASAGRKRIACDKFDGLETFFGRRANCYA
jgi:hypothetical protein